MYVGRFVVVSPEVAAYRVSSRSFPNRRVVARDPDTLTVVPTGDAAETDNPYVSYNCVRVLEERAVVGNGSHVDPIAEKIELGYPARDALVSGLFALDYEKDDYDTPRIAGTLSRDGEAYVGTVRNDALVVERVEEPTLAATYERDDPAPFPFGVSSAPGAARAVFNAPFDHRVCAVAVAPDGDGFETAIENGNERVD